MLKYCQKEKWNKILEQKVENLNKLEEVIQYIQKKIGKSSEYILFLICPEDCTANTRDF